MAEREKRTRAIEQEAKATKKLAEYKKELEAANKSLDAADGKYTAQQVKNLETKINKTEEYIKKVSGIKESIEKSKELTETISLASNATAELSKNTGLAYKNLKALGSLKFEETASGILTASGAKGAKFVQEITDAAAEFYAAQANFMAVSQSGTDEEAKEAYEEMERRAAKLKDVGANNVEFLSSKDGALANKYFEDFTKGTSESMKQMKLIAGLTDDEIKQFNELTQEADKFNNKLASVGNTLTMMLNKPQTAVGVLIIGLGQVISKVGQITREFGGFVGGLTGATGQTALLGTIFKDATSVTKELANQFGGVEETSFKTRLNVNLMATNMGISGEQAAKLVGTLSRTGNMTAQQAMDLAESTKQFAKQQGVIPSQAMGDIAENAEYFALYGAEAAEGLAQSAVMARKLGVTMSDLGKITDGLLDFESSITKELELSAMLGRNINLNRARGLAYEGKMGAAVKETLKQLGGVAAFNRMDPIQKKQAADLLGISVDQMSKMVNNVDKLNDNGQMTLGTFDSWTQSITALTTGPLGGLVSTIGSLVIAGGQFAWSMKQIGNTKLFGKLKQAAVYTKDMAIRGYDYVKSMLMGNKVGIFSKLKDGAMNMLTMARQAIVFTGNMIKSAAVGIWNFLSKGVIQMASMAKSAFLYSVQMIRAGVSNLFSGGLVKGVIQMGLMVKSAIVYLATMVKAAAISIFKDGAGGIGKNIVSGVKGIGSKIGGMLGGGASVAGGATASAVGGGASAAAGAGTSSIANAFGNINATSVLKGAAAMVLVAGAMFILGKAIQQFQDIGLETLGIAALAMLGLIGSVVLMGALLSGPQMGFVLMAAGAMLIVSASLFVLGKALQEIAKLEGMNLPKIGLGILGLGLALAPLALMSIPLALAGGALAIAGVGLGAFGLGLRMIPIDVIDSITNMVQNLVPLTGGILSLAGAFTLLAGSIGLLSIAGIAALPTLIALSAVGIGLGVVSSLFGGDGDSKSETSSLEDGSLAEYQEQIKTGMNEIVTAIQNKNFDVYIDGDKMTDFIRKSTDRDGRNYGSGLKLAGTTVNRGPR